MAPRLQLSIIATSPSRILQYQQTVGETVNDTVNDTGDTVKNDDTDSLLIKAIKEHPEYTYEEYAQMLDLSRATVARHIKKLRGTIIRRVGSDKAGYWDVMNGVK